MTREPLTEPASLSTTPAVRPGRDNLVTERVRVAAVGTIIANSDDIARLRGDPQMELPRHADEQTVLALAAVRQAAATRDLGEFTDWGVVVAPRWQGRFGTAAAIAKFHAVGVRGLGAHAIPNYCLHAPAATVGIAIGAHGPVFGAGGGPGHVADGLLAGLTTQLAGHTPGTWLALTDWADDLATGTGRAVALALVPHGSASGPRSLTFRPGIVSSTPAHLVGLLDFLADPTAVRWDCPVSGGELTLAAGGEP